MLKLKINVNLPQLLCAVVSAAQNGEFERFGGFSLTVTTRYKKETLMAMMILRSVVRK